MPLMNAERALPMTGPDTATFVAATQDEIARQFDLDVIVLSSVDPASGLLTSCEVSGIPVNSDRELQLFELEWFYDEPLRYQDLALSAQHAGALRLTTDPERVRRYVEIFEPHGAHDELRLACVADGKWWGTVSGYRGVGKPAFTPDEVSSASALSESLARGFRQSFLHAAVEAPGQIENPPGAFTIDHAGRQLSTTESAEALLSTMRPERVETVARTLAAAVTREGATTLTVGDKGGPLAFHAEPVKGADAEVSVVVEHPRPVQLTPLVVAAYELTPREREVAELVLQGLLTKQIARLLRITEYTVQDHLKSTFAKTGTSTRGELCLELFTRFYRPRSEQGISPGPYGFFLGD